jgi:hypothetical protein
MPSTGLGPSSLSLLRGRGWKRVFFTKVKRSVKVRKISKWEKDHV